MAGMTMQTGQREWTLARMRRGVREERTSDEGVWCVMLCMRPAWVLIWPHQSRFAGRRSRDEEVHRGHVPDSERNLSWASWDLWVHAH